MKKKILISSTLLAVSTMLYAGDVQEKATAVHFSTGEWQDLQQQALSLNRIFFVEFDANYCVICRNMEQSTFQHPDLVEYMNTNTIAFKNDIQTFDGITWAQRYQVASLPTILLFAPNGKRVVRLEGFQSAKQLLSVMHDLQQGQAAPKPIPPSPTAAPIQTPVAAVAAPVSTSASKPAPSLNLPPPSYKETPTAVGSPAASVPDTRPVLPAGTGGPTAEFPISRATYALQAERLPTNGFSVQVGVFSEQTNVIQEVERMEQRFKNQRILVNIERNGDKTLYRVMVGVFDTSGQANQYRTGSMAREGVTGIVRNLALFE